MSRPRTLRRPFTPTFARTLASTRPGPLPRRLPRLARLACLAVAALAAPAALTAPAQASDTVLAAAASTSGITAYAGQVVVSQLDPATNSWALVRSQNGSLSRLPVAERSVPFDADAGPDAAGNPVVVYSRCAQEPTVGGGDLAPTLDWETATGCELYVLPLTGSLTEHRLTAASAPGESETTPSMWRGNLAFVRHANSSAVPTIEYLASGATKPRHIGDGSVPACHADPTGTHDYCAFRAAHETIDQLDLGPGRIAYLWQMVGGSVDGTGIGWELRAATLNGGPSTLLDSGLISGTCGFDLPSGATATTGVISYLYAQAPCDTTTTSFATVNPVTGIRALAPTPGGVAGGAVRDGDTIYWLRVGGSATDVPVPGGGSCSVATAMCQLVGSSVPQYVAQPAREQTPPAEIDVVRSGLGYRWVTGPAGVRLLVPPATVPCAASAAPALVYFSAQWTRGKHTVRVSRQDPHRASHGVGSITRSFASGTYLFTRIVGCGSSTRITYAVTTGGRTQSFSFGLARQR